MVLPENVDPESAVVLEEMRNALPGGLNAISDIAARRSTARALVAAAATATPVPVRRQEHRVSGRGDQAALAVRSYTPERVDGLLPGIVFIHGGGMVMGDLDSEEAKCFFLSHELQAVVTSVDYRKAPENPYPAAPEDCYRGLCWVADNADQLGIDVNNIGVYGGSAGGNLAIVTAMLARDRAGPALRYVMALYPMLDDRNVTPSAKEITDLGVWDRSGNIEAWEWYLNGAAADGYAAPARATNLAGLPPTFIDVGDMDLFRDEDIEFAQRLRQSGVSTELHVYPGAYHGSEVFAPGARLSEQIVATRMAAMRRFIAAR